MFNHQVFDWLVLCPSLVKYGEKTRPVFVFFLNVQHSFNTLINYCGLLTDVTILFRLYRF